MGHSVSSLREREKRDRRDSRGDERGTGKKEENEWKWRNKNIPPLPVPATRIAGLKNLIFLVMNDQALFTCPRVGRKKCDAQTGGVWEKKTIGVYTGNKLACTYRRSDHDYRFTSSRRRLKPDFAYAQPDLDLWCSHIIGHKNRVSRIL